MIVKQLAVTMLFLCNSAMAGISGIPNLDHSAVIFAKVNYLGADLHGAQLLHFQPLATLSGAFDEATHDEIAADVAIDRGGSIGLSLIRKAPAANSYAIVTLSWSDINGDRSYFITNGNVPFVATGIGIVEVTGFDDPKVTKTIEMLREFHDKQREKYEKKVGEIRKSQQRDSAK